MTARLTELAIQLTDLEGQEIAFDAVTLRQGGLVQRFTEEPFAILFASEGPGTVEVEKDGFFPFSFPIDVKETGADFTATLAKSMLDSPAMVTLTKETSTGAGFGAGRNVMRIAIGKAREVVLVAGLDYFTSHSGGMQFEQLATQRMHALREAKTIDESTVVTVFECKSGLLTHWVMGRSPEAKTSAPRLWQSGWALLGSSGVPPTTLSPSRPGYPGAGVNGMPEVYRYLENVGSTRPKTVIEFSIMSHAWFGGPILYNTSQGEEFVGGGARSRERDPADRDGRFHKDFLDLNMPKKTDFIAAFANPCLLKVWGCFATDDFMDLINKARTATNDTQLLGVREEVRTNQLDPSQVFEDTRPELILCLKEYILRTNYMAFLAQTVGQPVLGGAPGMGALFKFGSKFGFSMFVARENVKAQGKTIIGFKKQMEFLETECGVVFEDDGYMRYMP
jgi:hypothetical protein